MRKEIIREAVYVFILAILFMACCVIPSYGDDGTYYVDFVAGDDTTGDGTTGTPWETIGKCTTSGATTGGGECRVAKMTPTATTGNLTFTNGSTSVSTASDETAAISAGDYVSLAGTGLVSASDEAWWRVASITSDTITLDYQYWGPGTGVAAQGYHITMTALPGDIDINNSGTSTASRLKISGGWDLTGPTQDGATFLTNYGLSFDTLTTNSNNFWEFSNFVIGSTTNTSYGEMYGNAQGLLIKDIVWVNHRINIISGDEDNWNKYENFIQAGGVLVGYNFYGETNVWMEGVISYSPGNGVGDQGVSIVNGCINLRLDDFAIYNAYDTGVYIGSSSHVFFKDLVVDTLRYSTADLVSILTTSSEIFFDSPSLSNSPDDGFYITAYGRVFINNPTFSGNADTDINIYYSEYERNRGANVFVTDYDGTTGDDRVYFSTYDKPGPYIQKDTPDARSGSCLKFFPKDADDPMTYRIGTFKATDGASNLTLSAYMKDDADWNGYLFLYAVANNAMVTEPEFKTMTTSYVNQSITVSSDDFATNDYVHLYVVVTGTAGSIYVDDFSASN